jgi:threonine dehydratase
LTLTLEDVRAAHAAIEPHVNRTPVLALGHVRFKTELFQRTGSFKFRGALNRIAQLAPGETLVKTVTAGNHGMAVALACREAGVEAHVFMPETASPMKVAATRELGATVTLSDDFVARMEAAEGVLVHPFDDPAVMAGAGTVALELLEQAPEVTTILVPASGGGLLSGICAARQGRKVIAVEPEVRGIMSAAVEGRPKPEPQPTIADGLTAPYVGEHCLPVIRDNVDRVIGVREHEIAAALRHLYAETKLAVEPSAAVGVAALLSARYVPEPGEVIGVVVSGGNVAPELAASLLKSRRSRQK